MNICLLTPQLPPYCIDGGVGHYVVALASGLRARGHDITVCGVAIHPPGRKPQHWGQSVSLNVPRVFRQGPQPVVVAAARRLVPPAFSGVKGKLERSARVSYQTAISTSLQRWIERQTHRFDLVEAPNWLGYPSHFTRHRSFPLVVRLSSPASECQSAANVTLDFERATCETADLVISNTQANLDQCRQVYGLRMEDAVVIHHGLDDVLPSDPVRSRERVEFLCLARVEPRKGLDILIAALAGTLNTRPACRFTFIGVRREEAESAFPELAGELRAACAGPDPWCRFMGKVEESQLTHYYQASHYVLIPSRYESFGLVAIESLRSGTPFIAAPSAGLVEVASKSKTARLVQDNRADCWTEVILSVCAQGPRLAESLRSQSRQDFLHHFTSTRMVDESLNIYHQVMRRWRG